MIPAGGRRRGDPRRTPGAGPTALLVVLALAGCAGGAFDQSARSALTDRSAGDARPAVAGPVRSRPLSPGDAVPDFSAPGLDGPRVGWSESRATPTVLIVWAPWCPHCRKELPLYARIAVDFPAIRVLGVTTSIGRYGGPSPQDVARSSGLAFPVAVDDEDNTVARALGVYRYPTVYWVGPEGRVRAVTEGELGAELIREGFDALAGLSR